MNTRNTTDYEAGSGVPRWVAPLAQAMTLLVCCSALAGEPETLAIPFAEGGKFKMLYDARQRPQSVMINGELFIVFNGDASPTPNDKGKAFPLLVRYDPAGRTFSKPARLGKASSDHHDSPIIWADRDEHLHVLYGCHRTPGVHLISEHPAGSPNHELSWQEGPEIAPKLSYPTVFRMKGEKDLVYYRTDGHTSSWTYRLSEDSGKTWIGPETDVTDLDAGGRLDWSSYQTKLRSRDGKYLHVVYTDYDDNKNAPDPSRFFNPRYNAEVPNEWKYNLSYVRIDPERDEVTNADGQVLKTPIDWADSKAKCEIWDTQWRGAGVPPAVALDRSQNPVFLHVLSGASLDEHQYYYVHRVDGEWKQTKITDSTHQWNSGHLTVDDVGDIHAFVITGDSYLEGGYMDRHGGGRIEEWVSQDNGKHFKKRRQLSPARKAYRGWRFNNVQPVVRPDGSVVNGMLLFYGWKDPNAPEASAFLYHESGKPRRGPSSQ